MKRKFKRLIAYLPLLLMVGSFFCNPSASAQTPNCPTPVPGVCVLATPTTGSTWTNVTSAPFWLPRREFGLLTTTNPNEMWVIGGFMNSQTFPTSDVWHDVANCSAPNLGGVWHEKNGNAAFAPRAAFSFIEFNKKMWVIGGQTNTGFLNDVWNSGLGDGVGWSPISGAPGTPGLPAGTPSNALPTGKTKALVFNGLMYLFVAPTNPFAFPKQDKLFSSADGITWTPVIQTSGTTTGTNNLPFTGDGLPVFQLFNNEMWAIGVGGNGGEVWHSPNGTSWTTATTTACFAFRQDQATAVFDNKLWLTAGDPNGNDVYYSCNGADWFVSNNPPNFTPARASHEMTVFCGKMWIMGGEGINPSTPIADAWFTP